MSANSIIGNYIKFIVDEYIVNFGSFIALHTGIFAGECGFNLPCFLLGKFRINFISSLNTVDYTHNFTALLFCGQAVVCIGITSYELLCVAFGLALLYTRLPLFLGKGIKLCSLLLIMNLS